MFSEKHRRLEDAIEKVKTVLLALLVVSLIMLVVIYISGTQIYQSMTRGEEKKTFDKLWSVQRTVNTEGLDSGRLLPEFIGYKLTGSEPTGSIADRDAVSLLYRLISPCLIELFGRGSFCEPLGINGDKLFKEAAGSNEYIYIRYHEPVLYQMIFAYASEKLTIAESDVAVMKNYDNGVYVSEIIIIPDKNTAAHRFIAYVCDGEGNYYEFKQGENVIASVFYFSKLADSASSIDSLKFYLSKDGESEIFSNLKSVQPIIDAELETEDIYAEPVQMINSKITHPLMRLFGYNPDKLNGMIDENGVGIYIDSHSRIRLETGGFTYRAFDTTMGIKLESLLGYSVDDKLNLFDKLTAVDNLINSLADISPSLVGGEAALCLGDVYYEDGLLVFEYFNTFRNIRISGNPAVRAVLSQETLYSFELSAQSYKGTDSFSYSLSQSYVLRKLRETGKLTDEITKLDIRFTYHGNKAGWSVRYSSGEASEQPIYKFNFIK
jgi:hypothetical protein